MVHRKNLWCKSLLEIKRGKGELIQLDIATVCFKHDLVRGIIQAPLEGCGRFFHTSGEVKVTVELTIIDTE